MPQDNRLIIAKIEQIVKDSTMYLDVASNGDINPTTFTSNVLASLTLLRLQGLIHDYNYKILEMNSSIRGEIIFNPSGSLGEITIEFECVPPTGHQTYNTSDFDRAMKGV